MHKVHKKTFYLEQNYDFIRWVLCVLLTLNYPLRMVIVINIIIDRSIIDTHFGL